MHVYGGAAMVRSRYSQHGSVDGETCDQTFLMTDIFARRGGRWVAVIRHVGPLEPGYEVGGATTR